MSMCNKMRLLLLLTALLLQTLSTQGNDLVTCHYTAGGESSSTCKGHFCLATFYVNTIPLGWIYSCFPEGVPLSCESYVSYERDVEEYGYNFTEVFRGCCTEDFCNLPERENELIMPPEYSTYLEGLTDPSFIYNSVSTNLPSPTSQQANSPSPTSQQANSPSPTSQQANSPSPTSQQANSPSPTSQQANSPSPTSQQANSPSPTSRPANSPSPTSRPANSPLPTQQLATTMAPTYHNYIDANAVAMIGLLSLIALFSSLIVVMLAVLVVLWCRWKRFYKQSSRLSSTKQLIS